MEMSFCEGVGAPLNFEEIQRKAMQAWDVYFDIILYIDYAVLKENRIFQGALSHITRFCKNI